MHSQHLIKTALSKPAPPLARSSSAQSPYAAGRKRRVGRHARCPALAGPGGLRSTRVATPSARGATSSELLGASGTSRAMRLHVRRVAPQGSHTCLVPHQGPQNTSPRLGVHSDNPTRFLGHVFPLASPLFGVHSALRCVPSANQVVSARSPQKNVVSKAYLLVQCWSGGKGRKLAPFLESIFHSATICYSGSGVNVATGLRTTSPRTGGVTTRIATIEGTVIWITQWGV